MSLAAGGRLEAQSREPVNKSKNLSVLQHDLTTSFYEYDAWMCCVLGGKNREHTSAIFLG
jgi:hypothetical protein